MSEDWGVTSLGLTLLEVWVARVPAGQLDDSVRERLAGDLDAGTLARVARFRRDEDRDRGLAAHSLLRRRLSAQVGVPAAELTMARWCAACGSDEHGKPHLAGLDGTGQGDGPPIRFNISHAGELVAVALCAPQHEVGVDVEALDRTVDWSALRRSVFSDAEWEHTAGQARARTDMWSRKEATVKATGHGLATPLRSVAIDVLDPEAGVGSGLRPGLRAWRGTVEHRVLPGWDVAGAAGVADGYSAAVAITPAITPASNGDAVITSEQPRVQLIEL